MSVNMQPIPLNPVVSKRKTNSQFLSINEKEMFSKAIQKPTNYWKLSEFIHE